MNELAIRRALISVSDKSGLVEFARFLKERGVEILSTGGSAKALSEAGIAVKEVSSHTGFPEIMDGRVKTLHPLIHGGILARRDSEEHLAAASEHGIGLIDLVVVNLYPFEAALAGGADEARLVENIDVGGPAMIRAAAKNFDFVAVVTSPGDYKTVQEEMAAKDGALSRTTRRRLSAAAFARTSAYDAAISCWMNKEAPLGTRLILAGELKQSLRYGENPHQQAAFYIGGEARPGVATARQIQGKELSYNNLNDTDAAYELVAEFSEPAVVIAFGGIVAVNRRLDAATAALIGELFAEVVIAPGFAPDALDLLSAKKNLRLLAAGLLPDPAAPGLSIKTLAGGFLAQGRDNGRVARENLTLATRRAPSESEMADLLFAFVVAKHVKSNAIVYAKNLATVGIGAGQMSRVDSSRIAAWKAKEAAQAAGEVESRAKGSVIASDAFFPFADGLLAAAEAGATAVIQPGGSMRDKDVIAAADEAGLAMVFTGMRHFRH